MLPLLFYQLLLLLVPLTLLHALCGKKKGKNTGRSNMSTKSAATPGSKSELATKGGTGEEGNKGEAKTTGSGRISLHGVDHNTDTGTGANDQTNGDTGRNTGEGVNPDKASPGKVLFSSKDTRKKAKEDGKGKEKEKEKEKEKQTEQEQKTQVTASHKETNHAIKNKEDTVDGTQQTV